MSLKIGQNCLKDLPVFSIVMPVYNAEKYLNKSVESILKQDFPDFELIIVDDSLTVPLIFDPHPNTYCGICNSQILFRLYLPCDA